MILSLDGDQTFVQPFEAGLELSKAKLKRELTDDLRGRDELQRIFKSLQGGPGHFFLVLDDIYREYLPLLEGEK